MRILMRPLASRGRLWGDDGRMNDEAPEVDPSGASFCCGSALICRQVRGAALGAGSRGGAWAGLGGGLGAALGPVSGGAWGRAWAGSRGGCSGQRFRVPWRRVIVESRGHIPLTPKFEPVPSGISPWIPLPGPKSAAYVEFGGGFPLEAARSGRRGPIRGKAAEPRAI